MRDRLVTENSGASKAKMGSGTVVPTELARPGANEEYFIYLSRPACYAPIAS